MQAALLEFLKKTGWPLVKKYGWPAVVWLAKKIGPSQLTKLTNRQKAIKVAKATKDGRFAPVQLEGQLRYVVFSGDKPVESFPPVKGKLPELLAHYNGHGLQSSDE